MRGTVAKRLRRIVYGDRVSSSLGRTYYIPKGKGEWIKDKLYPGKARITADELRKQYQDLKRRHHGLNAGK